MVERRGVASSNFLTGQKPNKRSWISCIDCGIAYLKAGSERISTRTLKLSRTRRQRSFLQQNLEIVLRLPCTSLRPRGMDGSQFIFPWIMLSLPVGTLCPFSLCASGHSPRNTHESYMAGQNNYRTTVDFIRLSACGGENP